MKMLHSKWLPIVALLLLGFAPIHAQTQSPIPAPDKRFKTDILVIVAHPDDDTAVSTYLSKAVLDQGKRVAVIFTNRGKTGPNGVGMEQGKALADEREMEARRSLAARGITDVWFLQGQDTPTQDVLHSLETMGHGAALEEVVRLIRLTRPEVIMTWLPAYAAGENHGDHQAASVIAVEGFDLAGDPVAFPAQVTAPRQHSGIGNYGEGLHPWQVKKIYFFSDATHPDFLKGHGPTYLASDISSARRVPFSEINRLAWKQYATQIEPDKAAMDTYYKMPEYLVLGKSLVPSATTADVLAGIGDTPIAFAPTPGYKGPPATEPGLVLGGPWTFYKEFYPAHGLTSLEGLVPPQTALGTWDHQLWVPLILRNNSNQTADITLHSNFPAGWTGNTKDTVYHLDAGKTYSVQIFLTAPTDSDAKSPETLTWTATSNGAPVGTVALSVYLEYNGVPQ